MRDNSITIVFSIIGLLLHLIGVYTLKVRTKWNNQVIILMNLSLTEIILITNDIILSSMRLNGCHSYDYKSFPEFYRKIFTFLVFFGIPEITLSLILLTIDRLICVLSPLNYRIVAEEKSLFQKMVIGSWLISITSGLLTLSPKTIEVGIMFCYITGPFTVILFFTTYIIIAFKIKMSKSALESNANASQRSEQVIIKKHHLVPGLIISTFVLFYIIPFTLKVFYQFNSIFIALCPSVGYISDALIYIFLTKDNRDIIVKILRC